MKSLLLALLVLTSISAPYRSDEREAAADLGLRVMTFNLRYASDSSPNSWKSRLPVSVAQIRSESPDVFGTQEGLWRQIRDLENALTDYTWVGLGREGGSHGEFGAIFYKRERFELLEFDHFWLSDTPDRMGSSTWDNACERMVTWVRLRERETGASFVVYNTHFDHVGAEARLKSAQLVLAHVREHFDSTPVLLVGDFNAREASPPHATLVGENEFSDTWLVADERGPAYSTFGGYRAPELGDRRIDWILSRGDWKVTKSWVATLEIDGQYPSDHFPVLADVQLPMGK